MAPTTLWVDGAMDLGIADHGQRADREQAAQIAITLLADTAKLVFAPARVLLGHEADPGREVPPRSGRTEELECDWAFVKPEYASANRNFRENKVYGSLSTGGSRAVAACARGASNEQFHFNVAPVFGASR